MNELSRVFFSGVEPPRWGAANPRVAPVQSRVARGQSSTQVAGKEALDPFVAWLLGASGLPVTAYRSVVLQRRLPACLRQLRVNSGEQARALIERRPELRTRALSGLLIGVTGFFRDSAVFDFLRRNVLPSMLQKRPGLRVCSIGASHGQELYSMAMLLAEAGGLEASVLRGIDCREDAMARAAAGWFDDRELDGMEDCLMRYFIADGARWRVRPELRARIDWRVGDVFSLPPTDPWDIIFFRNVAIYLTTESHLPLWSRLAGQLSPGGILVTGHAEQPAPSPALRRVRPCIYEKVA